jgi:hypothetical protein
MRFVVGRRVLERAPRDIIEATRGVEPELIQVAFVEIEGVAFPTKQAFALLTGWARLSFTTDEATRVLSRLGFPPRRTDDAVRGHGWHRARTTRTVSPPDQTLITDEPSQLMSPMASGPPSIDATASPAGSDLAQHDQPVSLERLEREIDILKALVVTAQTAISGLAERVGRLES